jgi:hypothetical protein
MSRRMRRREFMATLGGAVSFPLVAHAQTERTRRIGALVAFTENDAEGQARIAAFRRQLQELGWSEGHNLQIDFRHVVGGDVERMRLAAAELVALKPDVIFVQSNPGVAGLQQVDPGIPAVFAQVIRVGGVLLAREQRRLAAIVTADVVGYAHAVYEQIYYSSLMPRTYLCARLLETLD